MRRIVLVGLLVLACVSRSYAADKPIPPKDAAAAMKLPEGFKVSLFAGEPDIVQPIAFTFDDRGRMWVVECMMYPKWSQDGKGGKDRVVILEDTDGDGTFDKKTVVIEDGVNLSGIELGFGGVYLCSSPNLIFIPIQDDKPGKPEILLDGWNIKDAKHNVFNGLIWGPDGWLYGCNGIQTKSKVGKPGTADKDRIPFDCGVWRFHPTKKIFDVVATGTTNPWGLDFDEDGEMFITNCVIDHLWHIVPGGRYTRMYGQDYNPYTYGYMGSAVDYKHWAGGHWTESRFDKATGTAKKEHGDAGGGHAHSGCAIYLGDNFPKEYRNTLFTANIHGNRLNNDGLESTKTGMKGVRRPDFLFANDPWFRGICVKQGPDGGLYTSDWSDTGECHNYDKADTGNGRIYRVIYGDRKSSKGDVSKMTDEELVKAQASGNEWLVRRARLQLQMRASENAEKTRKIADLLMGLNSEDPKPNAHSSIRRIWALTVIGGLTAERYKSLKADDHSNGWLLRAGAEAGVEAARGDLFAALRAEKPPLPPAHLFGAIRRMPVAPEAGMYSTLLQYPETGDPNADLALWYAVEPAVAAYPKEILSGIGGVKVPLVRRNIVRRYLSVPAPDFRTSMFVITTAIRENHGKPALKDILQGILDHCADVPAVSPIPDWAELGLHIGNGLTPDVRDLADEISVRFRNEVALKAMRERIMNKPGTAPARVKAIQLLASIKTPGLEADLQKLLSEPAVRAAAIRALANYADEKTPSAILNIYSTLTSEEKADAIQTLSSRATYASTLLEAVEKGTVPKGDISAFTARQIVSLKDAKIAAKLKAVWGEVKPANTNRAIDIKKYKEQLTPVTLAAGDASRGKAIFTKACATCHKLFGEGQTVGPELTGAQRSNLDYILENVVDPNAAVPNDYKMTQFTLLDGRQLSGLIKKETPQAITVRTVNEEVVIAVKEIDERKATNNSVMPEGLFDNLKPDEVRDLVKYLMSPVAVK